MLTHRGMLTLNLRFPGQYFDVESGFHYNVMRDYEPALGRYVRSDPIGLDGGLNSYIYAAANVTRYFDLRGLKEKSLFGAEVSLGLQLGGSGRAGPATFSGGLDLGTFRMRSDQNSTTITQGVNFSLGLDQFEFGATAGRSGTQNRLIDGPLDVFQVPAETLGGSAIESDFFLGFPSGPGTSGGTDFSEGDFVLEIGAALGIGLELSLNLSEGFRRFNKEGPSECW